MKLFLSYARADGLDAAKELRAQLDAAGLPAWHDLRDIGSDDTVWPQIEQTLKAADHLIVVVTPAALASDYVKREWRAARSNGATVVPVLGADLKRGALPRWLRRNEVYDLRDEERREKFFQTLRGPRSDFRARWDEGDEVTNEVPRPGVFAKIQSKLLDVESNGVTISTALHGRGGFGKSALASMLARDAAIREAFIDGVYWLRIGQDRQDVKGIIDDLQFRTTGSRRGYVDVASAAEDLRRHFAHRDALLIVDDIWTQAQIEPFLKLQGRCSLLITTRNEWLVNDLALFRVDAMTPEEALALLSAGLSPNEKQKQALAVFAKRFWHWAQLLSLSNGLLRRDIRDGAGLEEAIGGLTQALDAGDVDETGARNVSLAQAIDMSIDALDETQRTQCRQLAIFPEDELIPLSVLERLWGVSAYKAKSSAQTLRDVSLIASVDLKAGVVRLHDNIVHHLKRVTNADERRGWNQGLLERSRPASGAWCGLAVLETYLWRHLITHLRDAGAGEAAEALLIDYDWIKAKLKAVGVQELYETYITPAKSEAARLTGRALGLSMQSLAENPEELGYQLWGRLSHLGHPELSSLVGKASGDQASLKCVLSGLSPPGQEILRLKGHEGSVRSAAFSHDSKRIVTASRDKTARIWDAATGQEITSLKGHTDTVHTAAFSPDNTRIVTASDDNTARLWDTYTSMEADFIHGNERKINTSTFSLDGTWIVTVYDDNFAWVWDAAERTEIARLKGQKIGNFGTELSPDGKRIVTVSGDNFAQVWDTESGKKISCLQGHEDSVYSATFSPDGFRIVTTSRDNSARLWDRETGKELQRFLGHWHSVSGAAFSPDGARIVTACLDKTARIWDAVTGLELKRLVGHEDWVQSAVFSPDGKQIVTASDDKTVRLWDATTDRNSSIIHSYNDEFNSVCFSPDGATIVTASEDNIARLLDSETGRVLSFFLGHDRVIHSAAFSPNGQQIVTASEDETARLWDALSSNEIVRLQGHENWLTSAAFSPDGLRIVTASHDQTARIWDAATGLEITALKGHTGFVNSAAFSLDSKCIVTASIDGTARIWDAATGREITILRGHTVVASAAFSPDGTRIVTASRDRTARIWDAATGRVITRLTGHEDTVASAAFSPDGTRIVTASSDNTARIWDASSGDCLAIRHIDATCTTVDWKHRRIVAGDSLGRLHIFEETT